MTHIKIQAVYEIMKSIKIIIILAVVSLIGFACYFWMKGRIPDPLTILTGQDKEKWMISRIDSFEALADDTIIYQAQYHALKFDIETRGSALEFAPNNPSLNETMKLNLADRLYKTYVSKLIKTAKHVISNGTDKESLVLNLIKEVGNAQANSSLNDEDKKNELKDILATLNKYTEIKQFIAKANALTLYKGNSKPAINDILPQTKLESELMIPQRSYLSDLTFPVNCPQIRKELENISTVLFKKVVNYFIVKISQLSKMEHSTSYKNEFSLKHLPAVKSQLNSLSNIYGIDDNCFDDTKAALSEYLDNIYPFNNPYKDPGCN